MNNHTRKFFIYTRKSTDTEDRQVRSISDQLAELKLLAIKEDIDIIGNKYFEGSTEVLLKILTLGKHPKEGDENSPTVQYHKHMFDDAQARLEQLKKEAGELR